MSESADSDSSGGRTHPALRRLRGGLLVIHLFPAVMNSAAGLAFALIASDGAMVGRAVLVAASVFLVSASVGSMNDFLDVDLDRRTKPDKPIARGDISPSTAFAISVGAGLIGVLLSLILGLPVAAVALMVLASGLAYDIWLKGTVWSWVPYAIGIPALPVWGFLAVDRFTPVLLASFPLGALIALALYLANTIPDIRGDAAYGIKGLAQRLGVARSLGVTWGCLALSIGLLALTPAMFGNDPVTLVPGLLAGAVLLATMIADRLIVRSQASLRRGWYLAAILSGVLGIAWVISLPVPG
ncbi:UbiA family prenyltransferase [Bauldia sp.]|uniref:UbiA family prenyltransferase n=1 Tax=Bauldia sp. TaxID=2575872 RepID=UPI003BABAA75